MGFIIAVVPLLNEDLFGNYYGRNGVCFPLHSVREEKPTAKGYSIAIFLGNLKRYKSIIASMLTDQSLVIKPLFNFKDPQGVRLLPFVHS